MQEYSRYALYANGIAFSDAKIYGPNGVIQKSSPHYHSPQMEVPGGRFVLQQVIPNDGSLASMRVAATDGSKEWRVPNRIYPSGGMQNILISQSGNYLLIPRLITPPRFFESLFSHSANMRERYYRFSAVRYELFENPGRRRAVLHLSDWRGGMVQYYAFPYETGFAVWKQYDLLTLYPSPDGRTLAAIATKDGGKTHRCLIFKW
ncbi:MAG: hypothetical protein ACYC6A_26155 [Armatimonadota bacterium]